MPLFFSFPLAVDKQNQIREHYTRKGMTVHTFEQDPLKENQVGLPMFNLLLDKTATSENTVVLANNIQHFEPNDINILMRLMFDNKCKLLFSVDDLHGVTGSKVPTPILNRCFVISA
jgi:hypothetical protein